MKCFSVPFVVLLTVLFASPQAQSQAYYKPNYLFTIRDGLAQQQVSCFFEDSRGYIWLGSKNGLTRFDGRRLQPYTQLQGYETRAVNAIMEGPDGSIWYSSADTVYRFDGRTDAALPMTPYFLGRAATPLLVADHPQYTQDFGRKFSGNWGVKCALHYFFRRSWCCDRHRLAKAALSSIPWQLHHHRVAAGTH